MGDSRGRARSASEYDALTREKPGHEAPDDPKPVSADAQSARTRAINAGRLIAPPRDEWAREQAEAARRAEAVRAEQARLDAAAAKAQAEADAKAAAEAAAKAKADADQAGTTP